MMSRSRSTSLVVMVKRIRSSSACSGWLTNSLRTTRSQADLRSRLTAALKARAETNFIGASSCDRSWRLRRLGRRCAFGLEVGVGHRVRRHVAGRIAWREIRAAGAADIQRHAILVAALDAIPALLHPHFVDGEEAVVEPDTVRLIASLAVGPEQRIPLPPEHQLVALVV